LSVLSCIDQNAIFLPKIQLKTENSTFSLKFRWIPNYTSTRPY